jgi:threonine/homoserine/homoserine lactone efflux protein
MIFAILLGAAIGFISAIPVAGPVSAFIFSYGMKGKFSQARFTALGAGLGEAIYCFLAFWGFTALFAEHENLIRGTQFVAAALLAVLGVYFFRSKRMREVKDPKPGSKRKTQRAFLIGLGMSAANPSLIATWTAAATSIHSFHPFRFTILNEALFSVGVWAGIYGWFTLSLRLMKRFRERIRDKFVDRMLKGIGILLIGLAGWMVYRAMEPSSLSLQY